MGTTRIQGIVIAFFACFFLFNKPVIAQNTRTGSDSLKVILSNIYNDKNQAQPIRNFTENSIFLFMTSRTCTHCYLDLQQYFKKEYPNYTVNIICIIPKNPLLIKYNKEIISEYYNDYNGLFFVYYQKDKKGNYIIDYFANIPSPYFFLINHKKTVTFFNPEQTSEIIFGAK